MTPLCALLVLFGISASKMLAHALDVTMVASDNFLPVVSDGQTEVDFLHGVAGQHIEDELQAVSKFNIDVLAYETFSAPSIKLFGRDGQEDDVLSLELSGDSLFVDEYRDDDQEFAFSLSVEYRCKKAGEREIEITIPFSELNEADQVTRDGVATVAWKKVCVAGGARRGFSITTQDDEPVVADGVAVAAWSPADPVIVVGPEEHSTRFYLYLGDGTVRYDTPKFTVDQPFLSVSLRGEASITNVLEGQIDDDYYSSGDPQYMEVLYTCKHFGDPATVTITYDLGSFEPVIFSWKKHCGGIAKLGFDVSTRPEPHSLVDVVKDAVALTAYHPDSHTYKASKTELSTTFYLRAGHSGDVKFERPTLTVIPPGAFKPVFEGPLMDGGLITDEPQPLTVTYNCRKKGTATVMVTIVVKRYQMIEFSWEKECGARLKPAAEVVWTANQLLVLFCFTVLSVMGVLGFFWLRYKKRIALKEKARIAALRAQEDVEIE